MAQEIITYKFWVPQALLRSTRACKAEHEYMKPVSTCGLICGKPVGIVTHRSKYLSDTGHYRSESANLKQQVLVTSTC